MKSLIKEIVKKLFLLMGLDVTLSETGILSGRRKYRFKWICDMNIKTIIDVGANIGQSVLEFRKLLPNARIYSFEPLRNCYEKMNANLRNVPNFRSFNLALGEKKGKLNIHRSKYSLSSSLLKMGELHKEAFPHTSGQIFETIDVDTLDNVAQKLDLEDNILLKIDTQGYEDKVLNGAENTLSRVKIIIIETSFCELYEGQPLFSDIYKILSKQGFVYSGSMGKDSRMPLDGTHLQQDSIFIAK